MEADAAAADAAVGEVSEDMSEDVTASAANDSGSDSDTSGPSCVGAVVDEAGPADDPADPSAGEAMSGGLKAGGLLHALHAVRAGHLLLLKLSRPLNYHMLNPRYSCFQIWRPRRWRTWPERSTCPVSDPGKYTLLSGEENT